MKAMLLTKVADLNETPEPLVLADVPIPQPKDREVQVRVFACGVCHTELDEIEGRTPPAFFPMILGHQVVGEITALGQGATRFKKGSRIGVAWINAACGSCLHCRNGLENLCTAFVATGRDVPGGYAEYMTVCEDFVYPIPQSFSHVEAAPLLCAGAIGYRSLRLTGMTDGETIGLVGFGASAHLVIQMIHFQFPSSKIFVFARSEAERVFARSIGAAWTGDMTETPPESLRYAIDTTPVWRPVVEALKNLDRGGRLVINAIRKEDSDKSSLMDINYQDHIWLEKEITSVANITRRDVTEFLGLAAAIPVKPEVQIYALEDANRALMEIRERKIRGAKVLVTC